MMRTLLGMVLCMSLWAATTTSVRPTGPEWESLPKEELVKQVPPQPVEVVPAKTASLADDLRKPASVVQETEPDPLPPQLLIGFGLCFVAMFAYVAVTRISRV